MASTFDKEVLVEIIEGVGRITLNRPNQINAINDTIRTDVTAALNSFDVDDNVQVILISGNGSRGFCAGADIKEKRSETQTETEMADVSWLSILDDMQKPIICAIHGYCLGGGLEIALACDVRIAAFNAIFALPEVTIGLIPGGGGTQRLPRLIGLGSALDLALTGRHIDAAEAHRMGIVSRLAEDDRLIESAFDLAKAIASKPSDAVQLVKKSMREGVELSLKEGCLLERKLYHLAKSSDGNRNALKEFGRKPS